MELGTAVPEQPIRLGEQEKWKGLLAGSRTEARRKLPTLFLNPLMSSKTIAPRPPTFEPGASGAGGAASGSTNIEVRFSALLQPIAEPVLPASLVLTAPPLCCCCCCCRCCCCCFCCCCFPKQSANIRLRYPFHAPSSTTVQPGAGGSSPTRSILPEVGGKDGKV